MYDVNKLIGMVYTALENEEEKEKGGSRRGGVGRRRRIDWFLAYEVSGNSLLS